MSTREAAAILDITPDAAGKLCRLGLLSGSRLVRRSKRDRTLVWKVNGIAVHRRKRELAR